MSASSPSTSTFSKLSASAASKAELKAESLEKELPLLFDTLFGAGDDEEPAPTERRTKRRVASASLPPLPASTTFPALSPKSTTHSFASISASASASSSPVTPARLSRTSSSSPSTPSATTKVASPHFIFRSPASPTSSSAAASPYPALTSAARVSITPAPRHVVTSVEQQHKAGSGGKGSTVSSFFSFGKKATSPTASSSTTSPTSSTASSPSYSAASAPGSTPSSPVTLLYNFPAAAIASPRRETIVRSSYLLMAVDSEPVRPGHTFLSLELTPATNTATTPSHRLQVVEYERVIRYIDLSAITRCSVGMDDAHVVSVMYATKRAGSHTDSNDRVEFRLASLLDAQHVCTIINNVIARKMIADNASTAPLSPSPAASSSPSSPLSSSPPSPASTLSPTSPSSPAQSCVYQGWLELHCASDKGNPWQARYGRLYSNRLVLYRTASSSLPLHIYPLIVDPLAIKRSSVRTNRYQHIVVDLSQEQSGGRQPITLRCEGSDEFKRWMDALSSQLSSERVEAAATMAATEVSEKSRELSVSSSLSGHSLSSASSPIGSAKSLAPLLSNQRAFMSYVFEISTLSPFFPSTLPTPAAFLSQTPSTFLRRRHASLSSVELELSKYEQLLSSLSSLWNETRLVMVDEMEQSGSGQIGFSFPGFDTQVFDVGRLSVVCSGQLLPAPSLELPHPLTFTQHDYHSAIDSSSPLKEMMTQASPDLTDRLNSDSPSTRYAAKLLSAQSQRLLLHHCTIATHMKAVWSKWRSGDRVSWTTMAAVAAGGAVKHNARALACYAGVEYVWNPSLGALHRCIQEVKANHRIGVVSSAMSLPPLDTLAEPNNTATAGLPGVTAVKEAVLPSSASSSGASTVNSTPSKLSLFGLSRAKTSSVDTTVTSSPATPLSPASPTSPSPSGSPGAPTALPSSAAVVEVRCLVDPIHLVFLLRTLLHYRRHALSSLYSSLLPALAAHSREHSVAGVVSSLLAAVERERDEVVRVLSVLPSQAEIEREDKRQRKERKERRRDADRRRAAMEEKQREESLLQQIVETKQLLHEWEMDHSRNSDVSYFYNTDSGTSSILDITADGLMAEALDQSVADLLDTDRELPQLPSEGQLLPQMDG